jgi:hypothetical protein
MRILELTAQIDNLIDEIKLSLPNTVEHSDQYLQSSIQIMREHLYEFEQELQQQVEEDAQ